MDGVSLTIIDKIVLSAFSLEMDGKIPFSAEDLVVAAWKMFPDAFSMSGYDLPNSNRVFAEIMGTKPIRKRGWLAKVGEKIYQLTEAGRERAMSLKQQATDGEGKSGPLTREALQRLKRSFATRAFQKYISGEEANITFYDACELWGISPRSSAIDLQGKLGNLTSILDLAIGKSKQGTITFEHGGQYVSGDELQSLKTLNDRLLEIFAADLNVIRKRTDERKL